MPEIGAGGFRLVLQGYETTKQLPVYLVSGHVSRLRWRLFLLCFPGFVELNHMLTSCNPPPSANSTSGPLRLPQKQRGESERANDGIEDTSCLDVPENFGTQREFVPDWFAPGPFFSSFCTHIHTPLSKNKKTKKPCLNDSYHFWTTKELLLEQ